MIHYLRQFLTLLLISMILPACSRGGDFKLGVVISPEKYEVTNLTCMPRTAKAYVDGELVDEVHWWGEGSITNRLATRSPIWDIRYAATFADGTSVENSLGRLIFELDPGESQEFAFLVSPTGKAVTDCAIELHDSALNYG